MKRVWILILTLALALSLAACGGSKGKDVELAVFAAASMQETLTEIGENYQREHPGVTLVFNFDSSGTLKTQIEEGADCDIFISAGQKQMDQLDAAASPDVNTDGLDFVLTDTRFNRFERRPGSRGRPPGHGQRGRPRGPVHPEDLRLFRAE